jgi:hypothetical protein
MKEGGNMWRMLPALAVALGMALVSGTRQATAQEEAKGQPKTDEGWQQLQDHARALAAVPDPTEGIHLVVAVKRFYLPYHGPRERYDATGFFRVLKGGQEPEHGFFEFQGKPVLVAWKSNNRRAVEIQQDRAGCRISFVSAGKASVSVSAGPWSDRATVEIVVVPFAPDMPVSTLVKKYGLPKKKSTTPPSALQWNARQGIEEYWEYDKWPGCAIGIGSEKVLGILTLLPPKKENADPKAPPGKRAPAPGAVTTAPDGR